MSWLQITASNCNCFAVLMCIHQLEYVFFFFFNHTIQSFGNAAHKSDVSINTVKLELCIYAIGPFSFWAVPDCMLTYIYICVGVWDCVCEKLIVHICMQHKAAEGRQTWHKLPPADLSCQPHLLTMMNHPSTSHPIKGLSEGLKSGHL